MTRGRILSALILLGAIGIATSVYVFYFKDKLNVYGKDIDFKNKLEATLTSFEEEFKATDPEQVQSAWTAKINPWNDALTVRAKYFSFGKWSEHAQPPEDVGIIKYWYDTESNKMIEALYAKVTQSMNGRWDLFPDPVTLRTSLGVQSIQDWVGLVITDETILKELDKLSYGIKACELLLDARPTRVLGIKVWDEKKENMLTSRRIGYSFSMTAAGLVNFIESMRQQDRYFSIDGIRVTYPYIAYPAEPQLDVEMLIAQAEYTSAHSAASATGLPATAQDAYKSAFGFRYGNTLPPPPPEDSVFWKAWKWFNRVVLVRNV